MADFQSKSENNAIQPGNMNDILLFYALAEIQDLAGLTVERDRSVRAALAVRTAPLGNNHPLSAISNEAVNQPFYDHVAAGRVLKLRFRLHWALPHFQLAASESNNLLLKINADHLTAETLVFLLDYPEAARYFGKVIEQVKSPEYKKMLSNSEQVAREFIASQLLCLAQDAAAKENWAKAAELVTQGLESNPFEVDLLILGYQLPDMEPAFHEKLKSRIDNALLQIERKLHRQAVEPEQRSRFVAQICNETAWLLAGTNGDYASALALIESAIRVEPENSGWLDTLAHVYFLGKEYQKAVETQEKTLRLAPESAIFKKALERFQKEFNKVSSQ